mmetsp:Transcript_72443/g.235328  ORF Transcript_72443/g.235328 Transcript_72443/m.235328 type:complete len:207 (+) Transcript_72443:164-784(+)
MTEVPEHPTAEPEAAGPLPYWTSLVPDVATFALCDDLLDEAAARACFGPSLRRFRIGKARRPRPRRSRGTPESSVSPAGSRPPPVRAAWRPARWHCLRSCRGQMPRHMEWRLWTSRQTTRVGPVSGLPSRASSSQMSPLRPRAGRLERPRLGWLPSATRRPVLKRGETTTGFARSGGAHFGAVAAFRSPCRPPWAPRWVACGPFRV